MFERDGVIQRVKQVMIRLNSQAGRASDNVRVIGSRNLPCREHFYIIDGRPRGEAGCHRRHLGQPMHRLQNLQSPTYNEFNEG